VSRSTTGAPTCARWFFGDSTEQRHSEALHIVAQTEEAVTAVLVGAGLSTASDAAATARIVSAIMFLSMAGRADPTFPVDDILEDIRTQLLLFLPAGV
jgi:hypothetical protein